jgi:hypothetical protein
MCGGATTASIRWWHRPVGGVDLVAAEGGRGGRQCAGKRGDGRMLGGSRQCAGAGGGGAHRRGRRERWEGVAAGCRGKARGAMD